MLEKAISVCWKNTLILGSGVLVTCAQMLCYFNKIELHHIPFDNLGLIWIGIFQDNGSVEVEPLYGLPI